MVHILTASHVHGIWPDGGEFQGVMEAVITQLTFGTFEVGAVCFCGIAVRQDARVIEAYFGGGKYEARS